MDNHKTSLKSFGEGLWRTVRSQIREKPEVFIGAALAIPILLLFIYGLSTLSAKATWVIGTAATILVFFVGAISLDLEVGSMGLPNFGKVGFFALGAYTSTLLYSVYNVPFFMSVIAALAISSAFGYLISIPTVKLRADYFAIMTIAGGELIRMILQNEKRWLWAPAPIGPPTQVISNLLKIRFTRASPFNKKLSEFGITFFEDIGWGSVFLWELMLLIFFLIISVCVYWFVQQIRKSPYGRALRAIREDDITVTSVGKDVARFRWQVTTIAAFIAGIAGIMYATTFSAFEASDFRPFLTFDLYIFIIIGGLGNSRGAFAGTALVTLFLRGAQIDAVKHNINLHLGPETAYIGRLFHSLQIDVFINPDNMRFVILGSILILFLLFKPAGLIPEPRTNNEKYLSLLTTEQRASSDQAILARQSLSEKERIEEERDRTP
ncbi:MAG: branched-chain amino acid ABC transporter permease [Candidatus Heimdallarchaeota archaeon]